MSNQGEVYFDKLVDSYGIFAHQFTKADVRMGKEGYPDSLSYSFSMPFEIGRFGLNTYVNVYVPEKSVMVVLRVTDDTTGKEVAPYANVEVTGALQPGFMENEIKKCFKQLVPTFTDKDFNALPFAEEYVDMNQLAHELHEIGYQRGYLDCQLNNYGSDKPVFNLDVGTPTGNVTTSVSGTIESQNIIDKIRTNRVEKNLPYTKLNERAAIVKLLQDYSVILKEPRRPELMKG